MRQMTELGVDEGDIEESFTNYGNEKIPVCVKLFHRPSGLVVKCSATTNQEQNRFLARQLLADKIERNLKNHHYDRRPNKYIILAVALILILGSFIVFVFLENAF